jgi:hypothetical protein
MVTSHECGRGQSTTQQAVLISAELDEQAVHRGSRNGKPGRERTHVGGGRLRPLCVHRRFPVVVKLHASTVEVGRAGTNGALLPNYR